MSGSPDHAMADLRDGATIPAGALTIVHQLTRALEAAGIAYCVWKGTARLQDALSGIRDLDILADRGASLAIEEVLATVGFTRFCSNVWSASPAVEDYLALDEDTGRLVHLHLHYRLMVGGSHLNGYRLPWEALVLSSRQYDAAMAIYVADPHLELLLLIIRAALRSGSLSRTRNWLGWSDLSDKTRTEIQRLAARCDPKRLAEVADHLIGKDAGNLFVTMVTGEPSFGHLSALWRRAFPPLATYRTYTPVGAAMMAGVRGCFAALIAINRKYLRRLVLPGRTLPNRGLLVAFDGGDRRLRATVLDRTAAWLTLKLDVVVLDLDEGDDRGAGGMPAPFLARRERTIRRTSFRARSRGMIVLCDGLPAGQRGPYFRGDQRQASAPEYSRGPEPPDLIVCLRPDPVDPPDAGRESRSPIEGAAASGGLSIPPRLALDPSLGPEKMLMEVQRALWRII